MAKFNIEVELDWLEEGNIDEEIKKEVIAGLQNRLVANLERNFEQKLSSIITEKVETIANEFIEKIMIDNIANIQMPIKSSSWGSEVNYVTLSEFVGKQFEVAMQEKTLNERGGKAEYRDDKKYSIIEYLTKGYIAKELNGKVSDMIRDAKDKAEKSLITNLEQNLQSQLHADMVKRLNIPQLLQNLQNTIESEDK